jgi:hypothetical protein
MRTNYHCVHDAQARGRGRMLTRDWTLAWCPACYTAHHDGLPINVVRLSDGKWQVLLPLVVQ